MRLFAILALPALLVAAEQCEPTAEVHEALKRLDIRNVEGDARMELMQKAATALVEQYPSDFFVLRAIEGRYHMQDNRGFIVDHIRSLAAKHPKDSLIQVLQARALIDYDTAKALELLKAASHPHAHIALADIYNFSKFADKAEARKHVEAYFAACPDSIDPFALNMLRSLATPELAKVQAPRLRKRIAGDKVEQNAQAWEVLWNLEFKARPVAEHSDLRKQILADAERLSSVEPADKEAWTGLLLSAYKQANDTAKLKELEERVISEYPTSWQARSILRDRFAKNNPYPTPTDSEEKRQAFFRAQLTDANATLERSPGDFEALMNRFRATSELKDSKPEQVKAAAESMLVAWRAGTGWSFSPPIEWTVAESFIKHKIQIDQVPALIDEGWASDKKVSRFRSDRRPDGGNSDSGNYMKIKAAEILVRAAQESKDLTLAKPAVEALEELKPSQPGAISHIWSVKARFAEVDGRKLDALMMYRRALAIRPAPKPAKDELADNEQRLMKELGGSIIARALLDAQSQSKPAESTHDGFWAKPPKDMPAWNLSDLAGKTWSMKTLEGKTLLINVWATWCGPCRMEHPHLEKLYQQVKGRSDIQILSFNVDDSIGKVEPYMKEQNLTFPVLLAKAYVDDLIPSLSIPRNWIVDPSGKWRDEQIGFGNSDNWEQTMLERLEKMKVAKPD